MARRRTPGTLVAIGGCAGNVAGGSFGDALKLCIRDGQVNAKDAY